MLARRHDNLLRRIDAETLSGADLSALEADIGVLTGDMEVVDPRRTAALWSRYARRAATLGAQDVAAKAYARSADVSRKSSDRIGLALALHARGMSLRSMGQSAEALASISEAAHAFLEEGAKANEALARFACGRLGEDLGMWQEAAREYKRVLRIYIGLGERRIETAETLNRLGLVLMEAGQNDEGSRCFQAADKLCEELKDSVRAARLSMERARAHEQRERLDDALEDLERAAAHCRDAEDARAGAKVGMRRGTVLLRKGRPADAVPLLDAAISALEQPGDEASLTDAYVARARALAALGRSEAAIRDWTEGLQRSRGHEGPLRLAHLLVSRAADMATLGRLEDALRDATEGLQAFEKLGLKPQIAGAARARSALLTRLGRPGDALVDLLKAEEVYSHLGNSVARSGVALSRAGILSSLGRDEDALAEYERLISDLEGGSRPDLLRRAVMESGVTLCLLGKLEAALDRLGTISSAIRTDGTNDERECFTIHRARALIDLGRYEEGLKELDERSGRTKSRADDTFHAQALLESGRALRGLDRTDEALLALAGAERISISLGDLEVAAAARSERGSMHFARGEMREGIRELERAAEAAEKALRASAAGEKKSARLREACRPILANAMRALRRRGDASRDVVASAYRIAQVFHGLWMSEIVSCPRAARADEIQDVLPESAALIEIIEDGDWVTAFVMTRRSLEAVALGNEEDLSQEVEHALAAFETEASLRGLGRRVLDPVLALLPAGEPIRTLFISPDGSLSRVPFEALLTADSPRGANPRDWPYLVKAFLVSHVHSGTALREAVLAAREAKPDGRRGFVAFGHPRRAEPSLTGLSLSAVLDPKPSGSVTLPGTGLEVLRIARLFAGEKHMLEILKLESQLGRDPTAVLGEVAGGTFTLFLGSAATETALKTRSDVKDARVLHLACPGRADLDAPALSHLTLAAAGSMGEEDGVVTASELRGLELGAELVVLSASEAASGTRRPFEGLAGLPRAALAAGARSVLSTLWQVDDDAARGMLEGFYRMWLEGSAPRVGALATAKRIAIREGVAARAWSAYILWDAAP
jgi:CHAT domain-containing protein/predicted negative regulator of RcsB-dependent stress response